MCEREREKKKKKKKKKKKGIDQESKMKKAIRHDEL